MTNTMKHLTRKRSRRHAGATMVEVVVGAGISTVVLFALIVSLLTGMSRWADGTGKLTSEMGVQSGMRTVTQELREAMQVTVASNGQSLTYRLPQMTNGSYVVPIVWDGVSRSIEYKSATKSVVIKEGTTERVVLRNVVVQERALDGRSNNYRLFTAGTGSVTRQVTVMFVAENYGSSSVKKSARAREEVFLRNVPTTTQ